MTSLATARIGGTSGDVLIEICVRFGKKVRDWVNEERRTARLAKTEPFVIFR